MILFNFDVLAKPSESLGQRQPDPEGRYLWSLFHEREMGRICLIVNQDYDRELFEGWLKKEGVKAASYEFILFDDPVLKAERVHTVAAVWGKAKWYIDNDPRVCAETLKRGIPTIVAASPYVVRPEWDGGRMVKSWESLVDEIDTQALKAANKTWRDI